MGLKIENDAKRKFFQEKINENKSQKTELLGPRMRKRDSIINTNEQNFTDSEKLKRQSDMYDVRVDTNKFNSFLDKFESKDGRDQARQQMKKITKQQKVFDKQKKLKQQQHLEEQEAMKKRKE